MNKSYCLWTRYVWKMVTNLTKKRYVNIGIPFLHLQTTVPGVGGWRNFPEVGNLTWSLLGREWDNWRFNLQTLSHKIWKLGLPLGKNTNAKQSIFYLDFVTGTMYNWDLLLFFKTTLMKPTRHQLVIVSIACRIHGNLSSLVNSQVVYGVYLCVFVCHSLLFNWL